MRRTEHRGIHFIASGLRSLIDVPVMLSVVAIVNHSQGWNQKGELTRLLFTKEAEAVDLFYFLVGYAPQARLVASASRVSSTAKHKG